ncbi:MAG: ParB/RepB/Spo0J family partition protein [Pacificimonas sp.]
MSEDATPARRRPGLGRGLSALLEEIETSRVGGEENVSPSDGGMTIVPIARLRANPTQPRRHFERAALAELVDSIRSNGILQPIVVRKGRDRDLEIVAGERRWRAAQAARLTEVPVVIRDLDDASMFTIALIENIQREDLTAVEEAQGYKRLQEQHGQNANDIAEMVGKSRSHVANLVRLLDLPEGVLEHVNEGRLSMGQARALIGTDDPAALAERIIAEGLTARASETLARTDGGKVARPRQSRSAAERDPDVVALEERIGAATSTQASLETDGASGKLTLSFSSATALDALVARLTV